MDRLPPALWWPILVRWLSIADAFYAPVVQRFGTYSAAPVKSLGDTRGATETRRHVLHQA